MLDDYFSMMFLNGYFSSIEDSSLGYRKWYLKNVHSVEENDLTFEREQEEEPTDNQIENQREPRMNQNPLKYEENIGEFYSNEIDIHFEREDRLLVDIIDTNVYIPHPLNPVEFPLLPPHVSLHAVPKQRDHVFHKKVPYSELLYPLP